MNSIITNLLFSSLFLYSFTSINFRGVEEFSWIPNLLGLILCISFIFSNPKKAIPYKDKSINLKTPQIPLTDVYDSKLLLSPETSLNIIQGEQGCYR